MKTANDENFDPNLDFRDFTPVEISKSAEDQKLDCTEVFKAANLRITPLPCNNLPEPQCSAYTLRVSRILKEPNETNRYYLIITHKCHLGELCASGAIAEITLVNGKWQVMPEKSTWIS